MPGIYFAGTIGQGSPGLQKHGVPANSGAVHGARYNARVLAGHIAGRAFGDQPDRPHRSPRRRRPASSRPSSPMSPELFHQRGYLARVLSRRPGGGSATRGSCRSPTFLDGGRPATRSR